MTADDLIETWRVWLQTNQAADVVAMIERLERIAGEERRPSVRAGRMRLFRKWRRDSL